MSDQYVEVTHKGFLDRIIGSFVGVLFGIALFFGSFVLLWWNEGRTDLSTIAAKAIPVTQAASPTDYVFVTENSRVRDEIGIGAGGMPIPLLEPGEYLSVQRHVEMYSWVEEVKSETKKNVGGSSTTTKTYDYVQRWTDNPKPASEFKKPYGHENPAMPVKSYTQKANPIAVGNYLVNPDIQLPGNWETLPTSSSDLEAPDGWAEDGEYFYDSSPSTPRVGSIRMKFMVQPAGDLVTVFGRLNGSRILQHTGEHEMHTYRMFSGDKAAAVAELHGEYVLWIWLCRVGGFLMMFIGMQMIIGPISTLLDVLPFLGTIGRGIGGMILFPIALVLSVITIIVSMVLHSLVAMMIIGIVGLVGAAFYLRSRAAKKIPAEGRMRAEEPPPVPQ